jgi:lipopolysaccharide biosynthesis regulator YciM
VSSSHIISIFAVSLFILVLVAYFLSRSKKRGVKPAQRLYLEALKALVSGEDKVAFQRLKQVVTEDTDNVDAYLKLGDLFRKRGQIEKALQVHNELTLRYGLSDETRIEILRSLTEDYLEAKDWEKGVSILNDILRLDHHNLWAKRKLLTCYEELSSWEEATRLREELAKDKSEKEKSYPILALYKVFQGNELSGKGEYHKARFCYKEALSYDDKCVPAYLYLGEAYIADRRPEDAITYWRKLLEIVPQSGYLIFDRLEETLFEIGSYSEMAEIYNRLLKDNPKDIKALLALAVIYEKKGRFELAQQNYKTILEIDPNYLPAHLNLIKIYQETGQIEKAQTVIDELSTKLGKRGEFFVCSKCGHTSEEPLWKCPNCQEWNSYNI